MMFKPFQRPWLLVFYGLLAYGLFLLIQFPASLAIKGLPSEFRQQLSYASLHGSLWHGQAGQVRSGVFELGDLEWRLKPLALLLGRLDLELHSTSEKGTWQAELQLDPDRRILLESLQADLDSRLFDGLTRPFLLQGRLQIPHLEGEWQAARQLAFAGEVIWKNAAVGGVQELALGDIQATLQPQQQGSRITIDNRNSPLSINGTVAISEQGVYTARLTLRNRDRNRQDIDDLLKLLGRPDARGRVEIVQRGRLPL